MERAKHHRRFLGGGSGWRLAWLVPVVIVVAKFTRGPPVSLFLLILAAFLVLDVGCFAAVCAGICKSDVTCPDNAPPPCSSSVAGLGSLAAVFT